MKVLSPYIQEMDHEPQFVYAGLIPGQEDQQPAKMAKADSAGMIANVPVPMPRPTSF
jgi:D-alanyl-D-alanine carboxypeptidase